MQKRHQRMYETIGATGLSTEEVEVKEECQVMEMVDVLEPVASPKFGLQVV